jgi:hypothetical protein
MIAACLRAPGAPAGFPSAYGRHSKREARPKRSEVLAPASVRTEVNLAMTIDWMRWTSTDVQVRRAISIDWIRFRSTHGRRRRARLLEGNRRGLPRHQAPALLGSQNRHRAEQGRPLGSSQYEGRPSRDIRRADPRGGLVFKLVNAAAKTWRRLKGENQLPKVAQGVKFQNGIEVITMPAHHAA